MAPTILATYVLTMTIGTTIALMSTHWLPAWAGLEMSTLALLPIMAHKSNPRATEATTKYFMVQASAAAMILFAALTNAWHTGLWELQQTLLPFNSNLLTLGLALKLGLAPLHLWMPEVLQGVNLTTGLILCTWQKIAPFCLLLQTHTSPSIVMALGLTSVFMGGWAGLNQTQLRKLLAYSSIAHLGWMAVIMQFSPALSLVTFMMYVIMTAAVFFSFMLTDSTTINMLASASTKSLMTSLMLPLTLMSLGGLPPFTGFMPKWLIIHELTKNSATLTAALLIPAALINLYFYIRIFYTTSSTSTPNSLAGTALWRSPQSKAPLPMSVCITFSLVMLPMTPSLWAFFIG